MRLAPCGPEGALGRLLDRNAQTVAVRIVDWLGRECGLLATADQRLMQLTGACAQQRRRGHILADQVAHGCRYTSSVNSCRKGWWRIRGERSIIAVGPLEEIRYGPLSVRPGVTLVGDERPQPTPRRRLPGRSVVPEPACQRWGIRELATLGQEAPNLKLRA